MTSADGLEKHGGKHHRVIEYFRGVFGMYRLFVHDFHKLE